MFGYLDGFTRRFIKKLSAEVFYDLVNNNLDYPLLKPFLNHDQFWTDLTAFHFNLQVLPKHNPRDVFIGEYLFQLGKFKEAVNYNNFNALNYLHRQALDQDRIDEAIHYAQIAAKYYGIVGHLICLKAYHAAFMVQSDLTVRKDLALKAIGQIDLIKQEKNHPNSIIVLKNTGWDEVIENNYGTIDFLVKEAEDFFKELI